ncbi:hypothetical protein tb265_22940 [Gemmatimonadetes bacterium T265]|nr:hypothetical protein tb265_22940 [Gemmatimonadetes bacterium T265]
MPIGRRDTFDTIGMTVALRRGMYTPDDATDWRREVQRLAREYNSANLGRSVRDCVWYAGQVAVMALASKQRHLGVYPVLGMIALFVSVATGLEAFRWRRELRRDKAAAKRRSGPEVTRPAGLRTP